MATDIKDILRDAGDVRSSASGGTAAVTVNSAIAELTTEKLAIDGTQSMTGDLNMGNNDITNITTLTTTGNASVGGNVIVTGTVDGRNVSADGAVLDGIDPNATDDQTGAEIRALLLLESDTNILTDAQNTLLGTVETGATADQIASEVANTPSGNLAATDVQAALNELQTEIDGISGELVWQIVSSTPFNATDGDNLFVDTSGGARTVNLPVSPTIGDRVTLIDYKSNAETNNITVGRNSSPIQGAADDLLVNIDKASVVLVYSDGTEGWILTNR